MPKHLPILSIFGPTGAGKTATALALAKLLIERKKVGGVDIISADSRQVYSDIPILSGTDVPAEFVDCRSGEIRLHGIGMLAADESWSLGQFQVLFHTVYKQAIEKNRATLIVGGTALYHKQLLQSDPLLRVQPNEKLRRELDALSVEQLQASLASADTKRLERMNDSDRANPRRLVRAIEQAISTKPTLRVSQPNACQRYWFISVPDSILEERIAQRVRKRFQTGAVDEVRKVLALSAVSKQLTTACGLLEISQYLAGKIDETMCLQLWTTRELRYAQSQKKWYSQFPDVLQTDLLAVLDSVY
ncbi:MAG: hypothetical protein GW946_00250 [Candidatus Pacebacteria bacterium]|nr:hypothetical protein [Candidatus Paceibacterota bacterium]PIR60248.1 MAG: hypothetical protein COU67_02900 [Candidatus Pacebacteria bacterium CG10_big_fil_rev_8_21_14_0_10_44_54]